MGFSRMVINKAGYINEAHAKNIVSDAMNAAAEGIEAASEYLYFMIGRS